MVVSYQQPFETANFDIGDALLKNGIGVSALQSLVDVYKHNSTSRCNAAVSAWSSILSANTLTIA
jgi:hypothetical protein